MLVFQNDNVLPIEGFTTFGMSAKPGSTNPIGKFGTGLKNAVAIILRLGGTISVWRGKEEYVFYTKTEDFRGKSFDKVRMKRRKGLLPWKYEALPFTTELGKHWAPWMAFREIEANVRDEANGITTQSFGHSIDEIGQAWAVDNTTLIIVDCIELDDAFKDIDNIFLPDRGTPLFENDDVTIYEGENNHIFYRGMRVTDTRKPTLYTYEVKWVNLTEDRTSQWAFLDDKHIMKGLLACDDSSMAKNVVRNSKDHHESGFAWDEKKPSVGAGWGSALSGAGVSGRFATLRDNLDYGLGKSEDVEVCMTVREWEALLRVIPYGNEHREAIIYQMTEAGWRQGYTVEEIDEVAEEAEA